MEVPQTVADLSERFRSAHLMGIDVAQRPHHRTAMLAQGASTTSRQGQTDRPQRLLSAEAAVYDRCFEWLLSPGPAVGR